MALTNSQYQSIIGDYDRIRDNNRFTLEARKQQVFQAVPEYRELEDSVSSESVSAARAVLEGETTARERLRRSLTKIRQRQNSFWKLPVSRRIILSPSITVLFAGTQDMSPPLTVGSRNAPVFVSGKFPYYIPNLIFRTWWHGKTFPPSPRNIIRVRICSILSLP